MIGKMIRYFIAVIMALALFGKANALKVIDIKSPDDHIMFSVAISNGEMNYAMSADGNDLISASSMGLDFGPAGVIPSAGWKVSNVGRRSADRTWKPVWGKSALVRDRYNETTIELHGRGAPFDKVYLVIRAYNDGVAFRYEIPEHAKGRKMVCKKELTVFNFAGDYTAWFYHGERHNLGPVELTNVNGNRNPVMTIRVKEHVYMAILEADLRTGSPIVLNSKKGEMAFSIVSSPGIIEPGYVSSWRVVLYGKNAGTLVDSHVVQLLNPSPDAGLDFSWVKPGVSLWDRRVGAIRIDGFTYQHGARSTWVRMVDFAAKKHIPYLLIDSGWYGPQFSRESDPVNGGKANEVKQVIAYGKAKGVGIILYINNIGLNYYAPGYVLQQYSKWGAAGIKVGFMRGPMAGKNIRTRRITALCAKYHLLCDFHDGPVIPYGQLRTYPNAVTREYCHAQLDAHKFVYPKTFVTAVFVNMLSGPIDMNNGVFDLIRMRQQQGDTTKQDMYHHVYKNTVPSTVTSEAARTLITFSGITFIPDIPEDYGKFPELLSFISSERQPWMQSKTLAGAIGEYVVMARQAADGTWLVGAVTDESARKLDIPLNFLGGGNYEATIIQDGDAAGYLTNRTAYKVNEKVVGSTDSIPVRLAPGGGACLIIKKK